MSKEEIILELLAIRTSAVGLDTYLQLTELIDKLDKEIRHEAIRDKLRD